MTRRIAFVHDWLTGMRGGEKVLDALCERFPDAELFTLVHVPGSVSPDDRTARRPHTSFVQRLPFVEAALPACTCRSSPRPSSSSTSTASTWSSAPATAAVKSVIRPGARPHLCYCLTPMRYAWDQFDAYFGPDRIGTVGELRHAPGHGAAGAVGPRHGGPRGPLCRYFSLCCGQDPPIL